MPSHNRKDFLRCGIRDDLEAVSIDTCYLRSALRSIKDNTQTDISEAIRVERERNAKTLADLARAVQTILPEIAGFERREQKDMQRAAELRQEVMKMQETFDTVARRHNTGLSARTDMLLEIDALTQRVKTASQREKEVYDQIVRLRKELSDSTILVRRNYERLEFRARTTENEAARLRAIHEKRDRAILDRVGKLKDTLETLQVDTSGILAELGPLQEQRERYEALQVKLRTQQATTRAETARLVDKEAEAVAELERRKEEHAQQLASLRESEGNCEEEMKEWKKKERDVALELRAIQRKVEDLHKERERQLRVTEQLSERAREAQDDMQAKVGGGKGGGGGTGARLMLAEGGVKRKEKKPLAPVRRPHLPHPCVGHTGQRHDGRMLAAAGRAERI